MPWKDIYFFCLTKEGMNIENSNIGDNNCRERNVGERNELPRPFAICS
jgi:hypothetical protein